MTILWQLSWYCQTHKKKATIPWWLSWYCWTLKKKRNNTTMIITVSLNTKENKQQYHDNCCGFGGQKKWPGMAHALASGFLRIEETTISHLLYKCLHWRQVPWSSSSLASSSHRSWAKRKLLEDGSFVMGKKGEVPLLGAQQVQHPHSKISQKQAIFWALYWLYDWVSLDPAGCSSSASSSSMLSTTIWRRSRWVIWQLATGITCIPCKLQPWHPQQRAGGGQVSPWCSCCKSQPWRFPDAPAKWLPPLGVCWTWPGRWLPCGWCAAASMVLGQWQSLL